VAPREARPAQFRAIFDGARMGWWKIAGLHPGTNARPKARLPDMQNGKKFATQCGETQRQPDLDAPEWAASRRMTRGRPPAAGMESATGDPRRKEGRRSLRRNAGKETRVAAARKRNPPVLLRRDPISQSAEENRHADRRRRGATIAAS